MPDQEHRLTLRRADAVRLRASVRLDFFLSQTFRINPITADNCHWDVEVSGYNYTFEVQRPHMAPHELIAFHWHPDHNQRVRFPHVHLGYGAGELRHGLDKAHIPTGRLTIADIVRFAITELGVEPMRGDWAEILET